MNSVLSFKSDQPSTETGPEAAAAAEQTSALWAKEATGHLHFYKQIYM